MSRYLKYILCIFASLRHMYIVQSQPPLKEFRFQLCRNGEVSLEARGLRSLALKNVALSYDHTTLRRNPDFLFIIVYSKASRYAALRSADLGDTRFFIGSQNTWCTRILAKSLKDARFFIFWCNIIMPIHFINCKTFQFL